MKQKTINRLFGIVVVILAFIVISLRITEHKRVSFYNCYDSFIEGYSMEHDEVIELCEKILGEE